MDPDPTSLVEVVDQIDSYYEPHKKSLRFFSHLPPQAADGAAFVPGRLSGRDCIAMSVQESEKGEIKKYFDEDSSHYESHRYASDYKDCHQFVPRPPGKGLAAHAPVRRRGLGRWLWAGSLHAGTVGSGVSGLGLRHLYGDDRESRISISSRSGLGKSFVYGRRDPRLRRSAAIDRSGPLHWCHFLCIGPRAVPEESRVATKASATAVLQISKKYSPKSLDGHLVYPFLRRVKRIIRRGERAGEFDFQSSHVSGEAIQCDVRRVWSAA